MRIGWMGLVLGYDRGLRLRDLFTVPLSAEPPRVRRDPLDG